MDRMDDLRVNDSFTISGTELRISFARSGGPGGQNVNKVETKVEVRWTPQSNTGLSEQDREWLLSRLGSKLTSGGELVVTSNRTRDQVRNRQDALDKLAALVRSALERPKPRRKTRVSRASIEGRLEQKKQRSRLKKNRQNPL